LAITLREKLSFQSDVFQLTYFYDSNLHLDKRFRLELDIKIGKKKEYSKNAMAGKIWLS
jgi:hypothetical protein